MIRKLDGRVEVVGPITMASAAQLLVAGEAAIVEAASSRQDCVVFDLATASDLDSSCLALVFAWMRAAQSSGIKFELSNAPQSLASLAAVYDVADLLPA